METRDEFQLPYICNLNLIQVLSGCPSMPDATSLHHYLNNKRLKLNAFSGKDPAKGVFKYYAHLVDVWLLLM